MQQGLDWIRSCMRSAVIPEGHGFLAQTKCRSWCNSWGSYGFQRRLESIFFPTCICASRGGPSDLPSTPTWIFAMLHQTLRQSSFWALPLTRPCWYEVVGKKHGSDFQVFQSDCPKRLDPFHRFANKPQDKMPSLCPAQETSRMRQWDWKRPTWDKFLDEDEEWPEINGGNPELYTMICATLPATARQRGPK